MNKNMMASLINDVTSIWEKKKDRHVKISCKNGIFSVMDAEGAPINMEAFCQIDNMAEFEGIVDGQILRQIVSCLGEEVELLQGDGQIELVSNASKASIKMVDVPVSSILKGSGTEIQVPNLGKMMSEVAHNLVPDDPQKGSIIVRTFPDGEAILCTISGPGMSIRRSSRNTPLDGEPELILALPGRVVKTVEKMRNPVIIPSGEKVYLRDGNHNAAVQMLNCTAPVIPLKRPDGARLSIDVQSMQEALALASIFDQKISLTVNGEITVSALSSHGNGSSKVDGSVSGTPTTLYIDSKVLQAAFASLNSAKARVFIEDERHPIVIYGEKPEIPIEIVCPVNPDAYKE